MENTVGPLGQNVVCCLYCSGLVIIFGIYCQTLVVTVNQALGQAKAETKVKKFKEKTTNIKGNFRFRLHSVWMSLKGHKWQETWKHHSVNSALKGPFTPNENGSEVKAKKIKEKTKTIIENFRFRFRFTMNGFAYIHWKQIWKYLSQHSSSHIQESLGHVVT